MLFQTLLSVLRKQNSGLEFGQREDPFSSLGEQAVQGSRTFTGCISDDRKKGFELRLIIAGRVQKGSEKYIDENPSKSSSRI